MSTTREFEIALGDYMSEIKFRRDAWLAKVRIANNYSKRDDEGYVVERAGGRKYIKIIWTSYGNTSVHSFINAENGDIYKAAGWKAPSLNCARGNIFEENGADALTPDGFVRYL